tara:strand:- start:130 stop:885 length:756 start_codon:yes stop_codon:yes gene_type:complete
MKLNKSTLKSLIKEEMTKLTELDNIRLLPNMKIRDASEEEMREMKREENLGKLYVLSVIAPKHPLVNKENIQQELAKRLMGRRQRAGIENPMNGDFAKERFIEVFLEPVYDFAYGQAPSYEGDEDMHTYKSLEPKVKADLFDMVHKAMTRGSENFEYHLYDPAYELQKAGLYESTRKNKMKLNKSTLKQIIREEIAALKETSEEDEAAKTDAKEKIKRMLAKTSKPDMDDKEEDDRMAMPGDDDFYGEMDD